MEGNISSKYVIGNNVFSGGTINGQFTSWGADKPKREIDEKRVADAINVKRIVIDSNVADVSISAWDSSQIEVHCCGKANIDGEFQLKFELKKDECRVRLEFGNACVEYLRLDVKVPNKIFEQINVKSMSANISIEETVLAEIFRAETKSGNVVISKASSSNIYIDTISGNIKLDVSATNDINFEISSISGNVSIELRNIEKINLHTRTVSGYIKKSYKEEKGYNATIDVVTISGDIEIK